MEGFTILFRKLVLTALCELLSVTSPCTRVLPCLIWSSILIVLLLFCHQESHFGCNAEICDTHKNNFLKHRVFAKFMRCLLYRCFLVISTCGIICSDAIINLFSIHERKMHNIANVEVEYPVLRCIGASNSDVSRV